VEEVVDDSIVVDLSVAEGAEAVMEEGEVNQPVMDVAAFQQMVGHNHILHVGLVHIGPMLPPHMVIERLINLALTRTYFSAIPKPLICPPFKSVFLSEQDQLFKGSLSLSLGLVRAQVTRRPLSMGTRRRQIATLTDFQELADSADASDTVQDLDPPSFCATPI
jgi:ribosomal protein S19